MNGPRPSLALLTLVVSFGAACGAEPSSDSLDELPATEARATPPPSKVGGTIELTKPTPRAPSRQGSVIVRAPVEAALYVADEDHSKIHRIPLPLGGDEEVTSVDLPGAPAQILALADKILVTIRDPGLLLILKRGFDGAIRESARVALPADAWGVAVTPNEATAVITSAWTHKVSAVDIERAAVLFSVDVAREPRGVATQIDGTTAYISHLVGADLTRIDGINTTDPSVRTIALPAAPLRSRWADKPGASLGYSTVLSPDGRHLFTARHALGALGPSVWFGAATVDILSTTSDKPVAPSRTSPAVGTAPEPSFFGGEPTLVDQAGSLPTTGAAPFTQPRAMVYRASTDTLLVASEGDDTIVELDALAVAPALTRISTYRVGAETLAPIYVPNLCGAPSGIALSEDESTAYVLCRSTYDVKAVRLTGAESDATTPQDRTTGVRFAFDSLPADAALGRRIFYNATDTTTSGGLGCAGCHPEGRDDGFVWHELPKGPESETPIFVGSPFTVSARQPDIGGFARQTPMLAGRVSAAGPYGWHGESETLEDRLKGGFKLHRWNGWGLGEKELAMRAKPLAAFLRNGLVPPPKEARPLTPQEERGKALFMADSTQCSVCHTANTEYTDRSSTPLRQLPPPRGYDEDPNPAFKVPSLLNVSGTPPYFHDGRAATLEDVVNLNNNRMGRTNHLSREDRAALVAFLRTL